MKVKIDIETQTFVRFWLVIFGIAGLIGAILLAKSALITIGIAFFLALALNPPVSALASKLPGKSRIGATAIAYLIVVTLLGGIMFLVVPPIIGQTAKFAESVPLLIDKATSQKPVLDDFIKRYNLGEAVDQAIVSAKQQATEASKQLGAFLVNVVTGTFGWLINIIFVLVLGFFMLVEGPAWIQKFWDLYEDPDKLHMHKSSVEKMYRVVTGFVNGQIAVAAIGAGFVSVTLLIMSLFPDLQLPMNLALPLAVIVFVMELIPMVGAPLATVIVGLVLLFNSLPAALIFLSLIHI
jgi:predicted PurR-regulated permease PerM